MKIIIDSREQQPFEFENSEVRKLEVGDYSVEDYEDEVAVERKSVGDAISSVLSGRERFEKEWIRAGTLKRFFVVIEGTQDVIKSEIIKQACMPRGNKSFITRNMVSVLNTYIHWCVKFNVPVFFCFGRDEAKRTTYELLRASVKYLDKGTIPINELNLESKKL